MHCQRDTDRGDMYDQFLIDTPSPACNHHCAFRGAGRYEKLVVLGYIEQAKNIGGATRVYYK